MPIQHYRYDEAFSQSAELDFDDPVALRDVRDHIFGLGLISLQYNALEQAFKYIVEAYVDFTVANLLFDKASNVQRANVIRDLVKAKETDPKIVAHTNHLLTYLAICSENRNVLMHSSQAIAIVPAAGASMMSLQKSLKSGGQHIFHLELPDIKRVYTEILYGLGYLLNVLDLIKEWKLERPPTPLEKPALPVKLSPHQSPVT